jgi:phosphopantetheine--protein transferase-like protein
MSTCPSIPPVVQKIAMATDMPPDLECRLLMLDAPRDQLRIHAQVVLLELLADRLKLPVSQLEIVIAAGGKPCCPQALAMGISFSLSYAPPYACVVVGHGGSIGVDIERVLPTEPTWNLLESVFTEMELRQWLRLPAGELRRHSFTAAWTLKEALLKARGTGLTEPPQNVGVTFSTSGQVNYTRRESHQNLTPGPEHVGVIVVAADQVQEGATVEN